MHVQRLSDVSTAEIAVLRLADAVGVAWLDGAGGGREGRWSFVGAEPVARLRVAMGDPDALRALDSLADPRARGDAALCDVPDAPTPGQVPRWIGWIAYDAFRPMRASRDPSQERPRASFAQYDALAAFDHATGAAFLVGDDAAACERLAAKLHCVQPPRPRARVGNLRIPDPQAHLARIEVALDHIARGDIYQVNLARRWRAEFVGSPLALWLAMRAASPVPLGFYQDDLEGSILACTMERFLSWDRAREELLSRPIKGTLRREGGSDAAEAAALRANPKERAEHAMIVDLVRNDLGRVARVGTVVIDDLMRAEPYAGLHHLVSTVRCHTRPDATLGGILEATFPPGSVTGAPKIRAMQIIDALEEGARGVYTGAVGFVDRTGGLSLAVAIRTAVVARGAVEYWTGGGIVEASDPVRELAETELKARVFLDAAEALSTEEEALSRVAVLR